MPPKHSNEEKRRHLRVFKASHPVPACLERRTPQAERKPSGLAPLPSVCPRSQAGYRGRKFRRRPPRQVGARNTSESILTAQVNKPKSRVAWKEAVQSPRVQKGEEVPQGRQGRSFLPSFLVRGELQGCKLKTRRACRRAARRAAASSP